MMQLNRSKKIILTFFASIISGVFTTGYAMPIDDNKVNYFNLITIASIEDQNINKNEFKLSKLVNKECSSCHKISKELKKEVLNPEKYKLNTIKITLYD